MKTEHKIYAALGVLAVLGGGLYADEAEQEEASSRRTPRRRRRPICPTHRVPEGRRREDHQDRDQERRQGRTSTLEKKGDAWEVTSPSSAKANAANVRSLLDNLKELKVKESIDRGHAARTSSTSSTTRRPSTSGLQGRATRPSTSYFGKSGSRGQMARVGGKDGVYIVGGYSSYLYTREVKNWRETSILKFEDANAIQVDVDEQERPVQRSRRTTTSGRARSRKRDKDGKLDKPREEVGEVRRGQGQGHAPRLQGARPPRTSATRRPDTGLDKRRDERRRRPDQAQGQRRRHHDQGRQDEQGHEPLRHEGRRRRDGLRASRRGPATGRRRTRPSSRSPRRRTKRAAKRAAASRPPASPAVAKEE